MTIVKSKDLTRSVSQFFLMIVASVVWGWGDISCLHAEQLSIYVGTYTSGESEGICLLHFDNQSGKLTNQGIAVRTENPSFLAIHPGGRWLYAVNEIEQFQGESTGTVTAFRIDPSTGQLAAHGLRKSHGTAPCYLALDRAGNTLLVANYGSGTVASFPVKEDGSLGEVVTVVQHEGTSVNPQRQMGPHAHSINVDGANRYAVAADLGIDQLLVYSFEAATGKLTRKSALPLQPGAGPRHFAFHPDRKHAFAINELHSTLTSLRWNGEGELASVETVSTLPEGRPVPGNSTAEVVVSPDGRFVFGSNRGHDSIVVYRFDSTKEKLTYVENESIQGKTPRNFVIDPSGRFLLAAGQDSHSVVVFRIDETTGELTPAGSQVTVPMPVCLRFASRIVP